MFPKGKDLALFLPDVATFINSYVKMSSDNINGFLFLKKPGVPGGNFFRVKGATGGQVSKLRHLHNLPRSVVGKRVRGGWVEFSAPLGLDHVSLGETVNFDGYSTKVNSIVRDLTMNQGDSFAVSGLYVNGKACDYESVRWDILERGDVVVVVADDGEEDFGSLRRFDDMPTMEVSGEVFKGPFTHKEIAGMSSLDLGTSFDIADDLGISILDEVICPFCGVGDCDDHLIHHNDKIFVRKNGARPQLLYSVQSPRLIGDDATELLGPFARTLLDIKSNFEEWPPEVSRCIIDDEDVTRSTCGSTIESDSLIQVHLTDPRVELRIR